MYEKTPNSAGVHRGNQANILLPIKEDWLPAGIGLFFSTRGLNTAKNFTPDPYDHFNLASHVGDCPERVSRNRTMLLQNLPPTAKMLCHLDQVHGRDTHIVPASPALPTPSTSLARADALVSKQPGQVLGIFTADCAPVLMADPRARVIGAAHAGWRGARDGILDSCLESMESMGADRKNIHVIIGPCIRPPFYLVDPPFRDHFLQPLKNKMSLGVQNFFSDASDQGRLCFDLPGFIQARLRFLNLSAERIQDVEHCTYRSETTFFSHRRAFQQSNVPCGRQMSGIFLL